MVERNAKRLLHLIGDLLLITQIEAGKLELKGGDVDLAKLAADGVETARPQAERKRIELRLVCEEEPVVPGDSIRLAQVLDNLISNAVKIHPRGRTRGGARLQPAGKGHDRGRGQRHRDFPRRARRPFLAILQGLQRGQTRNSRHRSRPGDNEGDRRGPRGRDARESDEGAGTTLRVELPLEDEYAGACSQAAEVAT